MALLTNDRWREHLARGIDDATSATDTRLVAFVLVPEHVHLVVTPNGPEFAGEEFLQRTKRSTSVKVKADLVASQSRLLERLTIRERPGRMVFRFWQEGPGYDRNLQSEKAVMAAIDYVHMNPVRRGLVDRATGWRWSSAKWYETDGAAVDESLPTIHGLPPEFFV